MSSGESGSAHAENGAWVDGLADFSEALEGFRENGNRAGSAKAQLGIGSLKRLAGDPPAAIDYLNRALAEYRGLGDRFGQANTLNHLGLAHSHIGSFRAGAESFERAAELFRSLGPHPGDVSSQLYLGLLQENAHEPASAVATLSRSLTGRENTPSPHREALTRCGLGGALTALGRTGEAEENLERAMAATGRLDGHLVYGHVDGTGMVREIRPVGESRVFHISADLSIMRYVVFKGAVAVDGVSLTVNAVRGAEFEVNIIPHTLEKTVIGAYERGTAVNIEVDLLARYLERLVRAPAEGGVDIELLRKHGYARDSR